MFNYFFNTKLKKILEDRLVFENLYKGAKF